MILGLDFDGVMHPVNSTTEPKFCRLPLLEAWLREHVRVDVLITSSWREHHPLDEMQSYFAPDLQERVLGATPLAHRLFGKAWSRSVGEQERARYERQAEIEAWLEQNDCKEPWLALDDDPGLFEPQCQHLVLCDSCVGLTPERLEALGLLERSLGGVRRDEQDGRL